MAGSKLWAWIKAKIKSVKTKKASKKADKGKQVEKSKYRIPESPVFGTMSKPDKYKTPAEKGVAVPSTPHTHTDSPWAPYTIPYSGAGASRRPDRPNEYHQSHRETMFVPRLSLDGAVFTADDPKKKAQKSDKSAAGAKGSDAKGKDKAQ
ncbi:hypothetical protein Hte_010806 [Hypoxylon texense]